MNANVKAATLISPDPFEAPLCGVLDSDTDYTGNSLAKVRMMKPQDCCAECSRVPGCHAFPHTDHGGGTC